MNAMKDMVAIGMQCLKTINMFFLHSFRVGYTYIYIYFKKIGLSFEEPSIMGPKLEGYRLLTLTR